MTLGWLRGRLRRTAYMRKWVVLGAVIGAIAGLGAVAFSLALDAATHLLLGTLAGLQPATPLGEGGHPIVPAARPWAIPFVVALGGLISGVIVFRLAPEAEGHGTDAAIAAFHHGPRRIRGRIPLVKLVASAITIGSGGSAGREGPTAQIGAGFGSFLARTLDLDARDSRIAVAAGMAAGIGAIFRAPLGGAVMGAEIAYRDDVESDALVPSFVASVVGFTVFGAFLGFAPIFGRQSDAGFTQPSQLIYYAIIGLAAGIVGRLYIRSFYGFGRWFAKWPIPREFRPAIAGFAVGLIALALPGVLGTGYGWVQAGLDREALLDIPLWVVIALPFAKILATSLSIGSGGSGGVFGPGMVVGGLLGAAIWRLLLPIAPDLPASPAPFVIVGMVALFGSVSHAPLALLLMVAEMTDNLQMLPPAMIAIGVATVVVGDRSMYQSQLRSRIDSPAHRFRSAMPLMAALQTGDAARPPGLVLAPDDTAGAALARLASAELSGAPVADRAGALKGVARVASLRAADPAAALSTILDPRYPEIDSTDGLDDALGVLADGRCDWAPVTSEGRLVGIVDSRDIMASYRKGLAGNVRRVRGVGHGGALVEAALGASSALVGRSVAEIPWPKDVVVVAIQQRQELVVPRGDVMFEAGDRLTVFAAPHAEAALSELLASDEIASLEIEAEPEPESEAETRTESGAGPEADQPPDDDSELPTRIPPAQ